VAVDVGPGGYGSLRTGVATAQGIALALGVPNSALIIRFVRGSLLDVIATDYVRTARAKGLAERDILGRHALKNGLIPVATVMGLQLGGLIGGAVITEYVFALPGVGRLVVDAVFARDYPLVQGVVLPRSPWASS
jgi:peptide/nickel transport system permease protein